MLKRFGFGLFALLAALSLSLVTSVASAEDMACGYCKAVKDVTMAMHCDGCKDKEQCGHCADMAKKVAAALECEGCAKGGKNCGECTAMMAKHKDEHCQFCAAKKMLSENAYCCENCEKKGAKAAEGCPKCGEMRKAIMAASCKDCAAKKKG